MGTKTDAADHSQQTLPPDVAPVHDSVLADGTVIKGNEESPQSVSPDKKPISG
jgi:hypothetical protein